MSFRDCHTNDIIIFWYDKFNDIFHINYYEKSSLETSDIVIKDSEEILLLKSIISNEKDAILNLKNSKRIIRRICEKRMKNENLKLFLKGQIIFCSLEKLLNIINELI